MDAIKKGLHCVSDLTDKSREADQVPICLFCENILRVSFILQDAQ